MTHETAPGGAAKAAATAIPATVVTMLHPGAGKRERSGDGAAKSELHPLSFRLLSPHPVRRFIPLLSGDCALPDTLRCCNIVGFREESEAVFAKVLKFA
jgi:hypothetical protein